MVPYRLWPVRFESRPGPRVLLRISTVLWSWRVKYQGWIWFRACTYSVYDDDKLWSFFFFFFFFSGAAVLERLCANLPITVRPLPHLLKSSYLPPTNRCPDTQIIIVLDFTSQWSCCYSCNCRDSRLVHDEDFFSSLLIVISSACTLLLSDLPLWWFTQTSDSGIVRFNMIWCDQQSHNSDAFRAVVLLDTQTQYLLALTT